MANAEMVRIHTYNTKEETKMKNEAMNVRNQLPGGGFHGGEQQMSLPGGGFHGGEQQTSLPGGGFHRDEQQSDPSEGWQKVTLLLENGERADVLIKNAQAVCLVLEDGQEAPKVLCNGQLVPSPGGMFR
jgi:hypothetical protein